jgi:hypothetical protein
VPWGETRRMKAFDIAQTTALVINCVALIYLVVPRDN